MTQAETRPGLAANLRFAFLGNVAYTLSQFGMLIAAARLTSTAEVGSYAIALAITTPVFLFTSLKLRQVQVTDAVGVNEPGEFFALRALASTLGVLACVVVAVATQSRAATLTVAAWAVFKALEQQLDILYGALQRRERFSAIARSFTERSVLGLVVFAVVLWASRSIPAASASLALYTVIPLAACTRAVSRAGVPTRLVFRWSKLRALTWLSLPLALAISVGALVSSMPRFLLQHFEGAAAVGVFATLSYSLAATGVLVQSLSEAASPRLADHFHAGDKGAFRGVLRRIWFVGAAAAVIGFVGALLVGKPMLWVVFGPEYAAHWRVLVALTVAIGLQYLTLSLGTAVNAMRMFRVQLPISVANVATLTLVGWFTVPAWGLMGAAVAVIAGAAVQALWYVGLYLWRIRPAIT